MAMNMDAVLRIVAKVDGGNALQKLGSDLAGIGQKAGATLSPFGQMRGALRGVADVAATIGLATVGQDLLRAGVEAQASTVRINALAKSYGEVQGVTSVAARAAEQFALGNVEAQDAVTNLYGRLRPMGVSLKDIETVFFGVNKAAKQVGLSTYDTSEVLLQLSQALGSGKLQGDELRSIMERMPAVGQAVAKVMGVSASQIKELGSQGKITTEVMIRAAAELNKIQPPPPTPIQEFEKALKDLRTEFGENLLPLLTPFVQGITGLARAFASLPEPIQTAAIVLGALVIAAGPIASVITGIGQALIVVGGIAAQAGVIWAGLQTVFIVAFQGILTWLGGTFIPTLLAFFSGPVGWTVLAIAAVVAMAIAFREPLMKFAQWLWEWGAPIRQFWIGLWNSLVAFVKTSLSAMGRLIQTWWDGVKKIWGAIAVFFNTYVIQPIYNGWKMLTEALPKAMNSAIGLVKDAWGGVLKFIADRINAIGRLINVLIRAYNRLPIPDIPLVPILSIPAFAQGGTVNRPTLAMVGDGGEREYIVPESKMAAASSRFLAGQRGASVISTTSSSSSRSVSQAAPVINITTGPVMEFNGERYVSVADLERAMRLTAEGVIGRLRTPSARIALGMA